MICSAAQPFRQSQGSVLEGQSRRVELIDYLFRITYDGSTTSILKQEMIIIYLVVHFHAVVKSNIYANCSSNLLIVK